MNVHFPKMDVKISLHESCCSDQSLRGEPHTSFPNRLRSVLRWTSKHESAGRLRWTSNRAKLPFYRIQRGVRRLVRHPYEALKKKMCSEYVKFSGHALSV